MKQPTGYICSKCHKVHLSPGNWPIAGKSMPELERKLYRNHKKYKAI